MTDPVRYILSGLLGAAICTAIVACIVGEVRERRRKRALSRLDQEPKP